MSQNDYRNELFTGYNSGLKEKARKLRKKMTPEESHLWYDFLKSYPVRIYRQRSIDYFIADFYCSEAKLIIEIDGNQHYTEDGKTQDDVRTEILERYGLEVIRFTNDDIKYRFKNVCDEIDKVIKERK
ncbi:MAG: endonuclease domain-containing protein [Oscillospiraceae bacterium]|nr:endonuclease domain-containing protein [Oscillospiraceae bacterium]